MKLAIAVNKKYSPSNPSVELFIKLAKEVGFSCEFCREYSVPKADYLIIFGGDGTVLHYAKQTDAPTAAVNLGKLGFMSQISATEKDMREKLERLKKGDFTVLKRSMLEVISGEYRYPALNDTVLSGIDRTKSVVVEIALSENKMRLTGDGLIVSTPTGSTAYCLASGGPAIFNDCGVFAVTPLGCVNPTIVYPSDKILSVKQISGVFALNVDGVMRQLGGAEITVKKHADTKNFVVFENDFFKKLNHKLSDSF